MITTSINIEPYLAEYIRGKYNNGCEEAFRIPDRHGSLSYNLDIDGQRQKNQNLRDSGNLTFILPERRIGKDPKSFIISFLLVPSR